MSAQRLADGARLAHTGSPSTLSLATTSHALHEMPGRMLASTASGRGNSFPGVGARLLASILADVEDGGAVAAIYYREQIISDYQDAA
jgi:hypothetical protein